MADRWLPVGTHPRPGNRRQRWRPPTAAGQTGSLPPRAAAACRWPPAWGLIAVILALMLLVGVIGLRGVSESNGSLQTLYQDKQIPSNLANKMMFLLCRQPGADHARLQHDPANPGAPSCTITRSTCTSTTP